ncbi:gamma-glutamyltransferase [Streptomyces sulfonofaciens]|uniref:Glutathione hydrolase proenzyme n=1 Tax=Streptomyces sulfonofaciens TaxID=68272 RepID=A0A919L604_9ACTN|nr:gamma-glutamyltransferase [Streptomyces sulfonofaciens]GHH85228.1 gamma-glutamyltransferase [Streptomyces sulfonofaciens]
MSDAPAPSQDDAPRDSTPTAPAPAPAASPARRTVLNGAVAAAALGAVGTAQFANSSPARATTTGAATSAAARRPVTTRASATPFGRPTASAAEPGVAIKAVRGSRDGGWGGQTRAEVLARNGVVATSQSVAAQAGLRILQEGGNSADAAVATAAMLGLVEPNSAGIGGDSFAIHYHAADRRLHGLNSSGWAPSAWTPGHFRDLGYTQETGLPGSGVHTITVPGAVEGWHRLVDRFGSRDLGTLLKPSIDLAEQGFGLTERIHHQWSGAVDLLAKDADSAEFFLAGGRAPALYGVFRNPHLAAAYRLIAREGRDAMYTGAIADAVVRKIREVGGAMDPADLADFRAEWVDPITVNYHGYDVYELPPNTQGFATLIMLNIIEQFGPVLGYDLAGLGPRSPQFWHLLVEAKKLAYDDLNRYQGDPRFVTVPLEKLLSKEYAKELCARIDPHRAGTPRYPGSVVSGTVYLTTADRWGNMTSFIYSIFDTFGSGLSVPGYGFPLQNRGALFNLDPKSPNVVAPHKRPYHTLIPAFVMKDGRPVLSFGNMGGAEQPQAQATELVNMIDLGMNPQAAADAARFAHNQYENTLGLEPELYDLVGEGLKALGHHLTDPDTSSMGGYQAIHFTPEHEADHPAPTGPDGPVNGVYRAASDHRKDGSAVGW